MELLKRGYLYYLWIQASIILVSVLSGPLSIVARFITDNRYISTTIYAISGTIIELVLIAYFFARAKLDDKRIELKVFLKPVPTAFSIHFIVSLINGFYIYTAGPGVSDLSMIWASKIAGEYLIDKREAPLWPNIVLFVPMLLLILTSIIIGFKLAVRKQEKQRKEIIGEKSN